MKCKVEDCETEASTIGFCLKHYTRWYNYGDPNKLCRRENGTGTITKQGYVFHRTNGANKSEHRIKAELALGKNLPPEAIVHHINGNKSDNRNTNLVICPNKAYHELLHTREAYLKYLSFPNSARGVYYHKGWFIQIRLNGKAIQCRGYASKEEAIKHRHQIIQSLLDGKPFKGEYL